MSNEPIKVYLPTDEEEAIIQAQIAADPDCPELTDAQLAAGVRFFDVETVLVEGEKNPVPEPDPMTQELVYIYIDKDVVAYFRNEGEFWQERVNAALRRAAFGDGKDQVEDTA